MSRTTGKLITVTPQRARPPVAGAKLVSVKHPSAIGKVRVHPADVEMYEAAAANKPEVEADEPKPKAKRSRRKPANKAAEKDTADKAEPEAAAEADANEDTPTE